MVEMTAEVVSQKSVVREELKSLQKLQYP